ncbi:SET domain-containing protein [Candidatus Bathyarchaeota archaeon]|nr:SET domain-containing protein [Candidatus Bathyarchaeota archaeon]
MHAIRDVPGKGKGLFATRKIAKGTRILSEEPLLEIPPLADMTELYHDDEKRGIFIELINKLSAKRRKGFLALHNAFPDGVDAKYIGRLRTNAFRLNLVKPVADTGALKYGSDSDDDLCHDEDEDDDELQIGIFRNASRINHDCESNAHNSWNSTIKRYTIYALRDIDAGEEITINYTSYTSYTRCFYTREERQKRLRERYAFDCSCRLCSLPPDKSQGHDKLIVELRKKRNSILDGLMDTVFCRSEGYDDAAAWEDLDSDSEDDYAGSFDGDEGLGVEVDESTSKTLTDPTVLLQSIEQEILFYIYHGFLGAIPGAFDMAGTLCVAYGDLARGHRFYDPAERSWSIIEGGDSPNAAMNKIRSQNPLEGSTVVSADWESAVEDVP